jgi:hypothetical protein
MKRFFEYISRFEVFTLWGFADNCCGGNAIDCSTLAGVSNSGAGFLGVKIFPRS